MDSRDFSAQSARSARQTIHERSVEGTAMQDVVMVKGQPDQRPDRSRCQVRDRD